MTFKKFVLLESNEIKYFLRVKWASLFTLNQVAHITIAC
jgi:hypothetical protein